jgi:hypothetical protein
VTTARRDPLDVYKKSPPPKFQVVKGDPPPKLRGSRAAEYDAIFDEVAKLSGSWAKVCETGSTVLANRLAPNMRIRAKQAKTKVEITSRGSAVYVWALK